MRRQWILISLVLMPLACVPFIGSPPDSAASLIPKPGELTSRILLANTGFTPLSADLWSAGHLHPGELATVDIVSAAVPEIFFLDEDGSILDAATGVRRASFFVAKEAEYFVYLHRLRRQPPLQGWISLRVQRGQQATQSPEQLFLVDFDGSMERLEVGGRLFESLEPMDLAAIGATDEEKALLSEIEPVVRRLIIDRLNAIFCQYNMRIVGNLADTGANQYSTVYFTNQRGEESDNLFDTTPDRRADVGLQATGEPPLIWYGIAGTDLGNRVPDDDAIVFFGSFLGEPGLTTSVNDLVNVLAHCAAHEMGHLVGLQHVFRRDDIMWGRPNLTFLRNIDFGRAQVVTDEGSLVEFLFQDPDKYLKGRECSE